MSSKQIFDSLGITVSDKELTARLEKHLAAAKGYTTKLTAFVHVPGSPIYAKFVPGPGGHGERRDGKWGVGLFESEKDAPPPGEYKLIIKEDTAVVINGGIEVWAGKGVQEKLEGSYVVAFKL